MAYIDYYLPYECYSKDESIKLTINRELEVIDLHFDNNYYNDYYISDLEPYGWDFDEYNRWWSNVLNDFNFKYAINLINDYNSDPLGVLDYLDELEMTENIRSFDGMISTYLLPYFVHNSA